jgi:hypothetical protein
MLLDRVFILENYDGKETATVPTTKRNMVWLAFKLNSAFQETCAVWNSSPDHGTTGFCRIQLIVAA